MKKILLLIAFVPFFFTNAQKTAIIPASVIITDTKKTAEEKKIAEAEESLKWTNMFYSLLLEHKKSRIQLQDAELTSVLLKKANADLSTMTNEEIAKLLGVNEVIKIKITRDDPSMGKAFVNGFNLTVDISIYNGNDLVTKEFEKRCEGTNWDNGFKKVFEKLIKKMKL